MGSHRPLLSTNSNPGDPYLGKCDFWYPVPTTVSLSVRCDYLRPPFVIEAPLGGVPPPKVFGVRRVAIRKGVWKKKAWRFEFSWRRSYGFSSRLCPRQVLGFSALSSASSWIFLAKLAEDLAKNNKNQVKIGGVWEGVAPPARAPENMPRINQETQKIIQRPLNIEA